MQVSCFFAPQPDTPHHIELAENLGYTRALCFDSPAMGFDVYMTLARAAERTSSIGLAPGILVPALRDVVVTASALATLAHLAPGRVSFGVGTGATGMRMLDLKQMRWASVLGYVQALQGLLRGDQVTMDGRTLQLLYPHAYAKTATPFPIEIPFFVATEGPKGAEFAVRAGADGVATASTPPQGFDSILRVLLGTVLDEGESPISDRVRAAAGPGASMIYHVSYEYGGAEAVHGLPNGEAWVRALHSTPETRRHLEQWHGHLVEMSRHDESHIPSEVIPAMTVVRDGAGMRELMAEWADAGVTEAAFSPAGDIESELRRLAAALELPGRT